MKALVKFAKGREGMALREVPEPSPGRGEIKIKIAAAGVCGSDIHTMLDERQAKLPVILGHEFSGQVCELGEGVNEFQIGDWVVALPAVGACRSCDFCRRGEYTLCDHRASIGTHLDGAMTEYLVIPAHFAFLVPACVDKTLAAAAEPLACCVRGIYEKIDVRPGDVAVVSGPGLLGLFCLQLLKRRGARVVVSGLPQDAQRLELARELGADAVVVEQGELERIVKEMNPRGADIAAECATAAASVSTCIDVLGRKGTFLQVGVFSKDIPVDLSQVLRKELVLTGTNSTSMTAWKITMELLGENAIQLAPLVSGCYPLDAWEKAFDLTMSKTAFKVLLIP